MLQLFVTKSAEMSTDGDDTYAEVSDVSREAFQMDINKCYSNVKMSSNNDKERKQNSSKKQEIFSSAILVFVVVMMMVLVATCVCAITALIQIAALQRKVSVTEITSFDSNSEELIMLRQNFSSEVQELRQNLTSEAQELRANNTEELIVFKQNITQLNSKMLELRAHNSELRQNFSQINSEVQQMNTEYDHNAAELRQNFSMFNSSVQQLRAIIDFLHPGTFSHNPSTSCTELSSPSGYYWVKTSYMALLCVCTVT